MKKLITLLIPGLITFFIACHDPDTPNANISLDPIVSTSTEPTPKLPTAFSETVIPDTPIGSAKPIFHDTIDERTKKAGIGRLRNLTISEDDIEIRIWRGFGLTTLEGFVMRRIRNTWSAIHLDEDYKDGRFIQNSSGLKDPVRGWEAVWRSLNEHHILSLPNAEDINCSARYNDGISYVVEIKKGDNYRTYLYDNPSAPFENRCKEADEILAISAIISKDFGIAGF